MRDHEFGDPARIACEAGRGSRDDVALQPQLLVLAAQAGEFVTFGGRQPSKDEISHLAAELRRVRRKCPGHS
jgi:hypothetical protein